VKTIQKHSRLAIAINLALVVILAGSGCAYLPFFAQKEPAEKFYLSHNLWYGNPREVVSLNYKLGSMIPAGTEVSEIKIYPSTNGIFFREMLQKKKIRINFQPLCHPNISILEYSERLFTSDPPEQLLEGLSAEELSCVKAGEIRKGISKTAVLRTLGYPDDRSHAVSDSVWVYWMENTKSIILHFGEDDRLQSTEYAFVSVGIDKVDKDYKFKH